MILYLVEKDTYQQLLRDYKNMITMILGSLRIAYASTSMIIKMFAKIGHPCLIPCDGLKRY
jgi:hypothetical protein